MLHEIEVLEARRIAELAAAARDARTKPSRPYRRRNWANHSRHVASIARWDEAMTAAGSLSDETVANDLIEELDLHDQLMKGLYEIGAAEPWTPPS